jgi:hypothetical protein
MATCYSGMSGSFDPVYGGRDPSLDRYYRDELQRMKEHYERELVAVKTAVVGPTVLPVWSGVVGIDPAMEKKKIDSSKHKDLEVFDDPLSVPKDWKPWEPQWESTKPSKGICSEAAYFGWGKSCR